MNIKKIQEIVEIMNENGLTEIVIEEEGSKIRLSKGVSGVVQQIQAPAPAQAAPQSAAEAPWRCPT